MAKKRSRIDLSEPRRRYYSDECNLSICPECGSDLIKENCTVLLCAKSDSDDAEFMTNLPDSYFCTECPVVVFDVEKLEEAAAIGLKGDRNLRYLVAGFIDLESIPDDKKHLEIGCEENPVPLVHFLPDINHTVRADDKPGRNDPCPCGSGKKYKKCCMGKSNTRE